MNKEIHRRSENESSLKEIDLILLIKYLWLGRKVIIKITLLFICVGLIVALISPKEFRSHTVIVPQLGEGSTNLSRFSGFAAITGLNLDLSSGGELSPSIYPEIVKSIPFIKELMYSEVYISQLNESISVYDFYQTVYKRNLIYRIKKYTIGLPGVVSGLLRKSSGNGYNRSEDYIYIDKTEKELIEYLRKQVRLDINDQEGSIRFSVSMPEALAAAQLTRKSQELLQNYITEFKIQKAQEELLFIQERYDEKEKEFIKAQERLARFRDQNKNITNLVAKIEEERLSSEFQLAYDVFVELAKQLENAKIKVKEDTPIFTIIDPVSVPIKRSKPKRSLIMIAFCIAGAFAGGGIVLGKSIYQKIRARWHQV